jgi:hypothetical protein
MYARAKIKLPLGEKLAVPENAVIHSGERKIVLVEESPGKFRPQPVRLGRMWISDAHVADEERKTLVFQKGAHRYHEVIAGIHEGDRIVVSGNFLLGSESKLQGALEKMLDDVDEHSSDHSTHSHE